MLRDDIIYVIVLLACTFFGYYYRQIKDVTTRQWAGTAVGIVTCVVVSGWHMAHPICCTLINALLITKLSWKVCHLASFYFSFAYLLLFFRLPWLYGLPESSGHTNLIMMILVLKMSGLGFEINNAKQAPVDDIQGVNSPAMQNITFLDVFHYAFSWSGVLTGPYFRYRTYWDFLHRPFADKPNHKSITIAKLIEAALFCTIFLVTEHFYPAQYASTEEYANRSFFYRVFYIYPAFLAFRMRLFTGMILSECVCYMSGLGAYPTSCDPVYGMGPRNYKCVEELSKQPENIKPEDIDFETVHNMYPWKLETCYLVRHAMKLWNTCIQYWMAFVVYKRFPYKALRIPATLTVSALWHGYAPGYYITICQVSLYVPMEDIWVKFYKMTTPGSFIQKMMTFGFWCGRLTCMAYLSFSFQLLDWSSSIKFYNNVYWFGHIALLTFYILGFTLKPCILSKKAKQENNRIAEEKKNE